VIVVGLMGAALLAAPAAERPVASVSAEPSRVELAAGGRATITLRNVGRSRVRVAARSGGLAVDARGRPRLVGPRGARNAAPWLALRPRDFDLAPGRQATVEVRALLPRRAEPGDHHAVVLLTSRPVAAEAVGVRMRVGVRVGVRVPGRVVRRLEVRSLVVRRERDSRALDVVLANRGNVTEELPRARLRVVLVAGGRVIAVLPAARADLLPKTAGLATVVYRGAARGAHVARVEIRGAGSRSFRIRL
jgi:hypothetical protein